MCQGIHRLSCSGCVRLSYPVLCLEGLPSEYDVLGEEEEKAVRGGGSGPPPHIDAIRVAIDFLDGRRAFRKFVPRGNGSYYAGSHETKAICALNSRNIKVDRLSKRVRAHRWDAAATTGPQSPPLCVLN